MAKNALTINCDAMSIVQGNTEPFREGPGYRIYRSGKRLGNALLFNNNGIFCFNTSVSGFIFSAKSWSDSYDDSFRTFSGHIDDLPAGMISI